MKYQKSVLASMFACLLPIASHLSPATAAPQQPAWQNAAVNEQNRLARHAVFFGYESMEQARQAKEQSARYLSMEGKWRFHFVRNHQDAPKDFFALKYDDSQWVDFPVPGLFELNGYGEPIYKNVGYAWATELNILCQ